MIDIDTHRLFTTTQNYLKRTKPVPHYKIFCEKNLVIHLIYTVFTLFLCNGISNKSKVTFLKYPITFNIIKIQ
jgi:hypothetical protein